MHWGYVIAGYAIVLGGIAVYTVSVLRRGRQLSERVPEERRRYLG